MRPHKVEQKKPKTLSLRRIILSVTAVLVILLAILAWYYGLHDRGMRKHLDADWIAASEVRMWKSYYGQASQVSLGLELIALLRGQFGLSYRTALLVGKDLQKAAVAFRGTRDRYEEDVLPPLTSAYARLRTAVDGTWEPEEVARAELAWWVARRTPEQSDPVTVGKTIAHQYSLLYGASNPDIDKAGLLRAQAAHLRDMQKERADWNKIGGMLQESYRALVRGTEH